MTMTEPEQPDAKRMNKAFMKLPLDGKVAMAREAFRANHDGEIEPGTFVQIAGDFAPMKRAEPDTVACPECGTGAGEPCADQAMYQEGGSHFHRARRAAAPVLVPGHSKGTVIGHEPHPYPDYPRKVMVQMTNGSVVSCNAEDLTPIE